MAMYSSYCAGAFNVTLVLEQWKVAITHSFNGAKDLVDNGDLIDVINTDFLKALAKSFIKGS